MKIFISGVHPSTTFLPTALMDVGLEVNQDDFRICDSCAGYGSSILLSQDTFCTGFYFVCLDDEGYPLS